VKKHFSAAGALPGGASTEWPPVGNGPVGENGLSISPTGARAKIFTSIFPTFSIFDLGPAWGPPWPRPGQAWCFDNFFAEILLFVIL
tara:strand:- start:176 stop:436 length:261 start_codon:yes stop_codon:yes gene_type:complete